MMNKNTGSPYERGSSDAYYRRAYSPHYYQFKELSEIVPSIRIEQNAMTQEQITEYWFGFKDQNESLTFKEFE